MANIDERLEALTQSVELLASLHKDNENRMHTMVESVEKMSAAVAKHDAWQRKVERSLIAALREWTTGDEPEGV